MNLVETFTVAPVVVVMFVIQFALQVGAVVAGLVIWDRFLKRQS